MRLLSRGVAGRPVREEQQHIENLQKGSAHGMPTTEAETINRTFLKA